MENYKEDIINTRVGCLGSSDGALLQKIALYNVIPKAAYKRMAIVKGLIPPEDTIPSTAMIWGDKIEMAVYNHIAATNEGYESNPLWVSKIYSRKNVKLIAHPDIVFKDEAKKILNIYEVKTTKFDVTQTRQTYKGQLYIELMLGREIASTLGSDWRVNLYLVHYDTNGVDMMGDFEFDINRLSINQVRFPSPAFPIVKTMHVVNNFLETFNEYYEGEEIDGDMLPEMVRAQFNSVTNMLREIQEREKKIDAFKTTLYDFMRTREIKSIKCDAFNITLVEPTKVHSFDHKKYVEDELAKHPRKMKAILAAYDKETNKKGYVTIKVKEPKDNN